MMSSALAAPIACATQLFELKEHRTFERYKLFTRGLKCGGRMRGAPTAIEVPRSCVGRCANAMFLRADGRSVAIPLKPRRL